MAFSSYDPQVGELLAQMTLEEKIGQMIQAECNSLTELEDVKRYYMGSIFSGGNGDPGEGNHIEAWADLYDNLQATAAQTRLGIPLLYGIDAVHGHNNVLNAVMFPHNIGLGCTRNPELIEKIGEITAREVRATGINWTFAPCVTVPQDDRWGRVYEGFSEDPAIAGELGEAAVRGLQGSDLSDPLRILSCVKHFAGDGGTAWGTGKDEYPLDRGNVEMIEQEFRQLHVASYLASIRAGAGSIMPSYSSWNGVKCSGNKRLLTGILKDELGFEGFLISDYNAIEEIPGDYREQIKVSVLAGMDMYMVPTRYVELYGHLLDLVQQQEVPISRIDDAVTRILRVKASMGLLGENPNIKADRTLQADFGSAAHREVARQAVRESLVLLKNSSGVLPLRKDLARIHLAGKTADDIGNMCGGWTISWQGQSGEVTPGGTTILQAVTKAVPGTKVTHSEDGSGAAGADVAIVVVGETPYAEMNGDTDDLHLSQEDQAAIANMKSAGIPVVVILVSGRVRVVTDELEQTDAFIAAWLPGTEGDGIADVLFGDYSPTGKLSYTWPKSMADLPIGDGDGKAPLFPLGYGLSY
jgi:beta-glucosidase